MIVAATALVIVLVLLSPTPALAWGPVTHVALGMQVLASVITPEHPLEATLGAMPEVFLYGSLAPDIVQGRRLQSRLRRHSHNWSTAAVLLKSARGAAQQAFAHGYFAHLAADVVAHNYFLPARFVGRFDQGLPSHILAEARFDSFQDPRHHELLHKIMRLDFAPLHKMLKLALDSPLVPFAAHQKIFEGGLKRIAQFDRIIKALGGPDPSETGDVALFCDASCSAIGGVLDDPVAAPACKFDPMGAEAIRTALTLRRNLNRLTRLNATARESAREMASAMLADLRNHLKQSAFSG